MLVGVFNCISATEGVWLTPRCACAARGNNFDKRFNLVRGGHEGKRRALPPKLLEEQA